MRQLRLLVTGSRDWSDREAIESGLKEGLGWLQSDDVMLVHGACPTGADALAHQIWVEQWQRPAELHPAQWQRPGKAAGPIRNQHMVDLGADLCLVFPLGPSRGTRHCMSAAERAGIVVFAYEGGEGQ